MKSDRDGCALSPMCGPTVTRSGRGLIPGVRIEVRCDGTRWIWASSDRALRRAVLESLPQQAHCPVVLVQGKVLDQSQRSIAEGSLEQGHLVHMREGKIVYSDGPNFPELRPSESSTLSVLGEGKDYALALEGIRND